MAQLYPQFVLLGYYLLYTQDSNPEFFSKFYLERQMAEQFAKERKNIKPRFKVPISGNIRGVRPTHDKTAMKAENHSKEGSMNTTVDKSGVTGWPLSKMLCLEIRYRVYVYLYLLICWMLLVFPKCLIFKGEGLSMK